MRQADIVQGNLYAIRIKDTFAIVRFLGRSFQAGRKFAAVNLDTKRTLHLSSAARLRPLYRQELADGKIAILTEVDGHLRRIREWTYLEGLYGPR